MSEWNAIDLHIHTVPGITRDKSIDKVNFSYSLFGKAINNHRLKLIACTNHNIIDIVNYILMRFIAKKYNCNILLGVELDSTMSMGKPIHIATIFEEDFDDNYNAYKLINFKTDEKKHSKDSEIKYSDDEIIKILKNYNCLLIPHGDKDRGIFRDAGSEQIEEALKKIREGFIRIFDSSSNWKFSKIKAYLESIKENNLDEFGGVLFSDNRDWEKYDTNFKNFYMNAEPTFKGLIHSISNPTKRFSKGEEIIRNNNYISKIIISDRRTPSRIIPCTIELSSGYNCIIGKSGSGKSLLLSLIKKYLKKDEELENSYSFSTDSIIEFFNEDGKQLDCDNINIGVGQNLYDRIISAISSQDSSDYYKVAKFLNPSFVPRKKFNIFKKNLENRIKTYCELVEDYDNNLETLKSDLNVFNGYVKKKIQLDKIKIFNLDNLENNLTETYSYETYNSFNTYGENIEALKLCVSYYKGRKKSELIDQISKLGSLLNYASKDIKNTINKEYVIREKYKIINNSINSINGSRSKQASEKSLLINKQIPETKASIINQVLNTFLVKKKIDNYDLSVKSEDYNSIESISTVENVIVKELIDKQTFTKLNERENGVFKTHGFKQELDYKTYDFTKKTDAKKLIDKYISKGIVSKNEVKFIDTFDVEISILFDGQNVRELNPGDIAKKYIEIYFAEQVSSGKFDVVLFDQIENDVDKEFINTVIRGLIEKTKGKVQLIVVTHDPIVAVNADPNNYIQSVKNNSNRISYRNFVAESSIKDELKTIADTVDGSKEVIKGRYEIYEGDKSYDN